MSWRRHPIVDVSDYCLDALTYLVSVGAFHVFPNTSTVLPTKVYVADPPSVRSLEDGAIALRSAFWQLGLLSPGGLQSSEQSSRRHRLPADLNLDPLLELSPGDPGRSADMNRGQLLGRKELEDLRTTDAECERYLVRTKQQARFGSGLIERGGNPIGAGSPHAPFAPPLHRRRARDFEVRSLRLPV